MASPPDYSHTVTVRYSECDAQGVVFNAHYQSLCDAVMDLWVRDRLGKPWQLSKGSDFSMVRSSRFEYLSPARFLDDLVIKARISKWGTSSFEIAWEGTVADEAGSVRDVFRGCMTHVCVKTAPDGSRKSTAIDPEFRMKFVAGGGSPRARL